MNRPLDKALKSPAFYRQTSEFIRALVRDPCALKPVLRRDDCLFDRVIRGVGEQPVTPGALAAYLADDAHWEFACRLLVYMVSSSHPFQPDANDPRWYEALGEIIEKLVEEDYLFDRRNEEDLGPLRPGEVVYFILGRQGELLVGGEEPRGPRPRRKKADDDRSPTRPP